MRKFISYLLLTIMSFTSVAQEFNVTQKPFITKNYIKNPAAESGITGVRIYSDAAATSPVDPVARFQ